MPTRAAPPPHDDLNDADRSSAIAFQNIVGESNAIRRTIAVGLKVAAFGPSTMLLHGETGTGKELFSRGIHYSGDGSGEPFVAINCAAIPENLLESELFGHERGAFSGANEQKRGLMEIAGRGTVFLDEIGELPIQLQPKLLRVVEERNIRRVGGLREIPIQCRIIAATNRDLGVLASEGSFRPDLYYRLSVVSIELPPLRERDGDVELLSRFFVDQVARVHGLTPKKFAPETLTALRGYRWPGNVRELRNAIEGAMIFAEGDVIQPEHVVIRRRASIPSSLALALDGLPPAAVIVVPQAGMALDEAEKQLIEATLRITSNNQSEASRMLQISRPTLLRKMRSYGLAITAAKPTSE
jgi:transcriptional regulator with PAS, ATPase and Fis domain